MMGSEALAGENSGFAQVILFIKEFFRVIRGHLHKFVTPMDRYESFGPIWVHSLFAISSKLGIWTKHLVPSVFDFGTAARL